MAPISLYEAGAFDFKACELCLHDLDQNIELLDLHRRQQRVYVKQAVGKMHYAEIEKEHWRGYKT